jgi:hypothetical protein
MVFLENTIWRLWSEPKLIPRNTESCLSPQAKCQRPRASFRATEKLCHVR